MIFKKKIHRSAVHPSAKILLQGYRNLGNKVLRKWSSQSKKSF
jgi:hypothetical protein